MISQRINLVFMYLISLFGWYAVVYFLNHPVEGDVDCCIEMLRSFLSAFRSVIVRNKLLDSFGPSAYLNVVS